MRLIELACVCNVETLGPLLCSGRRLHLGKCVRMLSVWYLRPLVHPKIFSGRRKLCLRPIEFAFVYTLET